MKTVIILACTLMSSFAFGQVETKETTTVVTTKTDVPVERGGKAGTVESFIPGTSITVRQDALTNPTKYPMAKAVVFEKSGAAVSPDSINSGSRVGVRLNAAGEVDQITLLDSR